MGECRNDLVALEVIKLARVIESAPVGLGKGEMQCKPTGWVALGPNCSLCLLRHMGEYQIQFRQTIKADNAHLLEA